MIHSIKQFSGKSMDTSVYLIEEILKAVGINGIYGVNCLALRPFLRTYVQDSKEQMIGFAVSIESGLYHVFDYFGIDDTCMETDVEVDTLMERLKENDYKKNPIIIGPVSKKKMWNRVDTLFYDNKSYFVTIIDRTDKGFYVHDPDGTPWLFLEEEFLKEVLTYSKSDKLLIHYEKIKYKKISEGKIQYEYIWRKFQEDLKEQCKEVQRTCFSGGDAFLEVKTVLGNRIRSSDKMRLYYNMIEVQNANQAIKEFFALNPFILCSNSMKQEITKKLDIYNQVVGELLTSLTQEDIDETKRHLLHIADLEQKMISLYLQ